MEDLTLIDKVLEGDEASFEQLFLKYQLLRYLNLMRQRGLSMIL